MILNVQISTGALYDCFELIYTYLNEGDRVRECYSYLKMIMQAHLHVAFFHNTFH